MEVTPELLKADFRVFLCLVWHNLKLPSPSKRQLSIARFLQHGPKRKVIMAWRGAGKSWITAAFVLWNLYRNPMMNIVVVSAAKMRADNFTTFCLQLIELIPELHFLLPGPDQQRSRVAFTVGPAGPSQTPSVVSFGITSAATGFRADLVVGDDIEIPKNSLTLGMREKLAETVKEFESLLKPDGSVVYLGTPQNIETLYLVLQERRYVIRKWTARYPSLARIARERESLDPEIVAEVEKDPQLAGHTVEPTRFSDRDLEEREASMGRTTFALQFMLDTSLSDSERYPLRLVDLMVFTLTASSAPERLVYVRDPSYVCSDLEVVGMAGDRWMRAFLPPETKFIPYRQLVMYIDPSGRGKDETGYAIVGESSGLLYLLDAGGFRDGFSTDTLQGLADKAKTWGVRRVLTEENFGGGMFSQLLRPVLQSTCPGVGIEDVKHYGRTSKERRICDMLEPVIQSHRLVVNRDLIEWDIRSTEHLGADEAESYQLFHQLTHVTREKGCLQHDDRLDAVAGAVAHFVGIVSQDSEQLVADKKREEFEQMLEEYEEKHLGMRAPPRGMWDYL